MKYEDWCKHSKAILAEAEKVNEWRRRSLEDLLTIHAPRVAALGASGYLGCGYHYEKVRTLGHLIRELALGWEPCANWCENVEKDRIKWIGLEVAYNVFTESLDDAEQSGRDIDKFGIDRALELSRERRGK